MLYVGGYQRVIHNGSSQATGSNSLSEDNYQ